MADWFTQNAPPAQPAAQPTGDWFAKNAPPQTPTSATDSGFHPLDSALNTIGNWWDQVKHGPLNLYDVGKDTADVVTDITGLATGRGPGGLGAENAALWQKAKDAYNAGDHTAAAFHILNYALNGIPGMSLGTSLDRAGEKFRAGDVSGGVGDTLGTATNVLTAAALPKAAEKVAGAPQAVKAVFAADPAIAINQALKFRPTADIRDIPGALADVKAAEIAPTVSNETLLKNVTAAKAVNRAAFDKWIDNKGDVPVSGAPILAATAASIPETMWIENPKLAQSIIDSAKGYAADLTADKLARILEEKNGELNAFYNRAQSAQQAAVQSGAPEAVVKAQRDAAAAVLYNFLDPENKGAGPRLIQRRYGAMLELEEAAQARANAIAREQPVSQAGKAVKVAQAAGQAIKLDPEKALHTFAGSDSLIRRALANVDPNGVYPEPQ
jgi:hypothetical protein